MILITFAHYSVIMKSKDIIGILLFTFLLVHCRQPEPYDALPVVEELGAIVEGTTVTLSAELADGDAGVVKCGFRYGLSEEDMVVKPSTCHNGRFSVILSGLEYSTEYKYSAFIGNGRNLIYSDISVFETGPRPDISVSESELHVPESGGTYVVEVAYASEYAVTIPDDVSWVSSKCSGSKCTLTVSSTRSSEPRSCEVTFTRTDDGSECVLIISQDKKIYELGLSSYEGRMPGERGTVSVSVTGDAEFEVLLPDGIDWLSSEVNGRRCTFTSDENDTGEQRECEVVFRSLSHDFSCTYRIIQECIVYELGLSSYESSLSGDSHVVTVTVTGNVDWEVNVPEKDVWWIYANVEGDKCSFFIDENATGQQRECVAVFKNSSHGFSCIHKIIQAPSTKKTFDIELNHTYNSFSIYVGENEVGYGWESDWIIYGGEYYRYMSFEVKENTSMSSRSETLRIYTDNEEYLVNLTQHSYLEYIDFECPVAKSVCVSLWDRNGDGEVSFEEAVSVTGISRGSFEGYDISSFDELKFFTNAFPSDSVPEYLFEGSSLTSVSLPQGLYEHVAKGMFKDCRDLERVDLGCRAVGAEAFMGCISLKEIDAAINDEKAFMGCTGLERVVQKCNWVPDMAFKDCSSLRTFTFEKVIWASSVTIGKEAFYGCSSLSEINDIPIDIEEIRESAFSGCASLEEIRLQYKLKTIGPRAFYGCSNLKAVYLTSGVPPTIGSEAFQGTSEDLKFYVPEILVNVYKSNWPDLADRIEGI